MQVKLDDKSARFLQSQKREGESIADAANRIIEVLLEARGLERAWRSFK